jgi:putative transcriptional regulator
MPVITKVKDLRLGQELTQEELAKACGVSRQTIISIEHGQYTPSLELALRLAKRFHVAVEDIFSLE